MAGKNHRSVQKQKSGRVVSDAMDKTIVILTENKRRHPLYGKTVRRRKKLYVHDEKNEAGVGDIVRVIETRPLSKTKRWRLLKIEARGDREDREE